MNTEKKSSTDEILPNSLSLFSTQLKAADPTVSFFSPFRI